MAKKESTDYKPRLLVAYKEKVKPYLKEKLNLENEMMIPKLTKIVLNMGIGDARENANSLKAAVSEMTLIAGQKPVVTRAKKAISNFKIRANDPVGLRVTLRGYRMYEFLDRFISLATPRIRDFRGLSAKGFDGRGNYNVGVSEQIIFPEINYDKIDKVRGMNITVVTTASTDDKAYELLAALGLPMRKAKKTADSGEAA
ncbi:MAG: 50S ribosomal protein L5 [FCB group bacterium]|nr:50S ribosomal protein L5 [FCB group bacterium]